MTGIVDDQGNIIETYSYSPYSEPSLFDSAGGGISVSLAGNRFMYTGREYDLETGLYCYRFRYYDPESHRFLSIDPIGIAGGLNVYGYVAANPQMLTDPFGFTPLLLDKNFWGAFPGEMLRTTGRVGVSALNFWPGVFGNDACYARSVNNSFYGQVTEVDENAKWARRVIDVGLFLFVGGSMGATGAWCVSWELAGNPTMEIVVGHGRPFHAIYRASGDKWFHASAEKLGEILSVGEAPPSTVRYVLSHRYITLRGLPILSHSTVYNAGNFSRTCIGQALKAWGKSFITFP